MDIWQSKFVRPTIGVVRAVLEWIGKHELKVMLALMLLVGSIWVFIELADEVMAGKTIGFDEWAVKAMRRADDPGRPIGPAWLTEVARDLTALGGIAFSILLTATIAVFLWLKRMYAAMWLVLAATLSGIAVSLLLKSMFARPRPQLVPHLAFTFTSSFPSGHAMLSTTVFLTLGALLGRFVPARVLKAYFLLVAIALSALVGLSRVYLGVHYPTDVLSGWAAGMAWAITCWLIARVMQRRHLVETERSLSAGDTTAARH